MALKCIIAWCLVFLAKSCDSVPLYIEEEWLDSESGLQVLVTTGGWIVEMTDVLMYTEKVSVSFVLPDVPDPLKQISKDCLADEKETSEVYCDFVHKHNQLNLESFRLLKLLNKVLTTRGLEVSVNPNIPISDDSFDRDPAPPSPLDPALPNSYIEYAGADWHTSVAKMLNDRRMNPVSLPALTDGTSGRKRRGWPLLAKAGKMIVTHGPALMESIGPLFVGENGILNWLTKRKVNMASNLQAFTRIGPEKSELVTKVVNYTSELASNEKKLFGSTSNYKEALFYDTPHFIRLSIWRAFESRADSSNLIFMSLLYNVHLAALASCRENEIPLTFVPPKLLRQRLLSLQKEIGPMFTMAIQPENVMAYYNTKSGTCIFDNDGGIIQVRIPLVPNGSAFTLLQYKSIVIGWDKYTCSMNIPSGFVVRDDVHNVIYPITSVDEETCNPRTSKECLVPFITADDTEHLCLRTLMEGGSTLHVRDACEISCRESTKLSVSQLSPNTFIIAHLPETAEISCDTGISTKLPYKITRGALQVRLPCGCEIRVSGRSIAKSTAKVCPPEEKLPAVYHYMPSYVTTLDDFIPHQENADSFVKYTHATQILNDDWKPPVSHATQPPKDILTWNIPIYTLIWNSVQMIVIMYILWRIHLRPATLLALFGHTEARSDGPFCKIPNEIYTLLYLIMFFSMLGFVPQLVYYLYKGIRKLFWRTITHIAEKSITNTTP